jgi:hypothetical protein
LTITTQEALPAATLALTGMSFQQQGGVAASDANGDFSVLLSPNPAGDLTNIRIRSAESGIADIKVFDARGREQIAMPIGMISAGEHESQLVTKMLPNGTYFVRVIGSNGNVAEARLVIQR